MNTINCIAIDDEPLALAQIASYIEKVPYLNLVAKCRDAFEATDVLSKEKVDLMFVDINMPDLNGLDFVKTLARRPYVVFTTAYSEYAIDGFKVEAVDYLLKPFSMADLMQASDKVRRRMEETVASTSEEDSMFVKCEFRTVKVRFADIRYIEGMSEYVKIYLDSEPKPLMPLLSMKRMEEALPKQFMRVHKSFIVNLDKVVDVQRQRIVFGEVYIPVGESYKDAFNEYINGRVVK